MGILGTLENYFEHPNERGRYVFYYYEKERGQYFVELLSQQTIWHEYGEEKDYNGRMRYYCILKRSDFQQAKHLNHLCIGKFRKPFIPNRTLGTLLVLFFIAILSIAIIGYFKTNG